MTALKSLFLTLSICCMLFAQSATRWQTTRDGFASGSCRLETNKINVTVHPFHLDIEEEAVILAEGSVNRGDPQSLEITGEFIMTPGTAIRSMLLWQGNIILKAKLRDRYAADSIYEDIVNRVVVRDPALIEQAGENRYRFKIFPVAINQSRKIRILYSVPLQAFTQGPAFEIKTAFTAGPINRPNQIPLTVQKGETPIAQYLLRYGSIKKAVQFGVTYMVPTENLVYAPYYYSTAQSSTFYILPDSTSQVQAYACRVDSGLAAGYYTAVFSAVPDSVLAWIKEIGLSHYTLEARVTAGAKSFVADMPLEGCIGAYLKSSAAWDGAVHWSVYDTTGWAVYKYSQPLTTDTASVYTRLLPMFWGAKYTLDEGSGSLGALYGFIDARMSLLAVEADSLPANQVTIWADAGVPPLLLSEILIDPAHIPPAPADNGIFEIQTFQPQNPSIETAEADASSVNRLLVLPNGRIVLHLKNKDFMKVNMVLYDIRGRVIVRWNNVGVTGGKAEFSVPTGLRGRYILRVRAGIETVVKKVVLK